MGDVVEQKETPLPGTVAKGGRRNIGAYIDEYRISQSKNQEQFYSQVISTLSTERMGAYGDCTKSAKSVLARYLLNMSLCECLYAPLQYCEVALRNAIHTDLSRKLGVEAWYDSPHFKLTEWATIEVSKAKEKICKARKDLTPGRIVAELQFGFWTSLFEAHYEQRTPFLPAGIKTVFPHLAKSQHNRKDIKAKLETIRTLRNRVFHHERIVHWTDLNDQHELILDVLSWINPELLHLAEYQDRFSQVRTEGLGPWLHKLDKHWSEMTQSVESSGGGTL